MIKVALATVKEKINLYVDDEDWSSFFVALGGTSLKKYEDSEKKEVFEKSFKTSSQKIEISMNPEGGYMVLSFPNSTVLSNFLKKARKNLQIEINIPKNNNELLLDAKENLSKMRFYLNIKFI